MPSITVIPEDKLRGYIDFCERKNASGGVEAFCQTCGKPVRMNIHPYAYDPEDNEVLFASVCPQCGTVILTRE